LLAAVGWLILVIAWLLLLSTTCRQGKYSSGSTPFFSNRSAIALDCTQCLGLIVEENIATAALGLTAAERLDERFHYEWTAAKATTLAAVDLVNAAAVGFHGWTAAKATTSAAVDLVDAASVDCHGFVGEAKKCVPTVFHMEWPPFIKEALIKCGKKGSI
jgi:hypothetical protein